MDLIILYLFGTQTLYELNYFIKISYRILLSKLLRISCDQKFTFNSASYGWPNQSMSIVIQWSELRVLNLFVK